ncbi:MAG: DUF4143 domain-containing protein [Candidatus Binatia bacterium]
MDLSGSGTTSDAAPLVADPEKAILDTHPARGMRWEAFIIDPVISICQREEPNCQRYFWHTAQGHEIDLVIDLRRNTIRNPSIRMYG